MVILNDQNNLVNLDLGDISTDVVALDVNVHTNDVYYTIKKVCVCDEQF